MFIIFGWGRRTIRALGFTGARLCANCRNTSQWKVIKVTRWFTLFFIPVIPYESRYVAMCPVCSRGIQVDAQTAQNLAAGGAGVAVPTDGWRQPSPPQQVPDAASRSAQLPPWARASAPTGDAAVKP